MKKIILLLLVAANISAQDTGIPNSQLKSPLSDAVYDLVNDTSRWNGHILKEEPLQPGEIVNADNVGKLMFKTNVQVNEMLKGRKRLKTDNAYTGIYLLYSHREKKEIPVEFSFRDSPKGLEVCHIQFPSRQKEPAPITNDVQTMFWILKVRGK